MREKFKRSWNGWIHSSMGYSVRICGRAGIYYKDQNGIIFIDSEIMAHPYYSILIYKNSISDGGMRSRDEIIERVVRAMEHRGRKVIIENA